MRELVINPSITKNDSSLEKYFKDIDKIKLISAKCEVELAQKIKCGDNAALNQLVSSNLRFVVSVAKQYQHQGLSLGDLINEGNLGLMSAARKYDDTKGFKFISYAVWWIRQSIIFAIAESRVVHLPYNQITLLGKLYKAFGKLEQDHGRAPSNEEVAEYLDISTEHISVLLSIDQRKVSLDQPFGDDGESTLMDILGHKDHAIESFLINESIKKDIHYSLSVLSKRDREVISSYFGLGACNQISIEGIAIANNLSVEHVRRIKDSALKRIRNSLAAPTLQSYLV